MILFLSIDSTPMPLPSGARNSRREARERSQVQFSNRCVEHQASSHDGIMIHRIAAGDAVARWHSHET
jgi:hypothetical protein